jgi:hypothetical protein
MEPVEHNGSPGGGRARRGGWLALGAAVLWVSATACAGDGDGDDALAGTESVNSTPTAAAQDVDDDTGDDTETGGGSEAGSDEGGGSGSGGSGEVLGTSRADMRASVIDDRSTPIRLDLTRLERVGEMVELTLILTNEAEEPSDGSDPQTFQADVIFSGGNYGGNARYDAAGIGLVDGAAQKMYLPAFDSEDVCLCTGNLNNENVAPGGTFTITATYGGVPEELERVDVRIPQFPTISGVEIQ